MKVRQASMEVGQVSMEVGPAPARLPATKAEATRIARNPGKSKPAATKAAPAEPTTTSS